MSPLGPSTCKVPKHLLPSLGRLNNLSVLIQLKTTSSLFPITKKGVSKAFRVLFTGVKYSPHYKIKGICSEQGQENVNTEQHNVLSEAYRYIFF
jgi:hypothetical protein